MAQQQFEEASVLSKSRFSLFCNRSSSSSPTPSHEGSMCNAFSSTSINPIQLFPRLHELYVPLVLVFCVVSVAGCYVMCIFCWLSYGSELMEIRMIVTAYIYLKYISSQLQIVFFCLGRKWNSFNPVNEYQ